MNELEQKYIDSREVAEMVGKEHKELLRDIRRYCEQLGESKIALTDFFTESTYKTEQNKTIDYGQQQVLGDVVNRVVIEELGGKGSPAYREIGKKVFAECNRDLKHYFNVNARNNVPKKRFDEAVNYVKNWKPCTNTKFLIRECNARVGM